MKTLGISGCVGALTTGSASPCNCVLLNYPGRVLAPGELIPAEVIEFIGAQLGLGADDLVDYAAREETRHEHLAELRGSTASAPSPDVVRAS